MSSKVVRGLILILAIAGASHAALAACTNDGDPCEDGNPCTLDDFCNAGACVPGHFPPRFSFCSADFALTIPTGPGVATPYPLSFSVNAGPTICHMRVILDGVTHTNPDDIDLMLSGPGGQNAKIMSDVGGSQDVGNLSVFLDDAAAASIPNSGPLFSTNDLLGGGTYRPTDVNDGTDTFPMPAPAPSGGSALSVFNGTNPNGTWNVWVVDDKSLDSGSLRRFCLQMSFLCTADAQCADTDVCTEDKCVGGVCINAFQNQAPPEVQAVRMAPDKTTISWTADPGAESYDVVRGPLANLPVGSSFNEICFNDIFGATSIVDSEIPAAGTGSWYIVRSANCADVGSYGAQSNGSPRVSGVCP